MKLIVHAPNLHQGGGRALLVPLLVAAEGQSMQAILDARLGLPHGFPESRVAMRVAPSLMGRVAAERRLRELAGADDTVLCFGNLPPLFPVRGRVILFLQNRYLLTRRRLSGFGLGTRLRITAERRWLRARVKAATDVIVQSPSMAREAKRELGVTARVLPFIPGTLPAPAPAPALRTPRYDFLYVASGEPHKNHRALVEAWRILALEELRPGLCLTLDPAIDQGLLSWIEAQAQASQLRIENAGPLSRDALEQLYGQAGALVYPSEFEAFGLPLIEAAAAGLPILAPELDYVRDVTTPAQTFDPTSPVSIARAVKRHLGKDENPARLLTPAAFLRALTTSEG
jgi:glycosyltransferase involved in cell wall biosynthesis